MFVAIASVYLNHKNHSLVHFSCSRVSDIETRIYPPRLRLDNFKSEPTDCHYVALRENFVTIHQILKNVLFCFVEVRGSKTQGVQKTRSRKSTKHHRRHPKTTSNTGTLHKTNHFSLQFCEHTLLWEGLPYCQISSDLAWSCTITRGRALHRTQLLNKENVFFKRFSTRLLLVIRRTPKIKKWCC